MNCLKSLRRPAALSRLLRHKPGVPAVRPQPPRPLEATTRCYHAWPRRPELLHSGRGGFFRRHEHVVRPPLPPAQVLLPRYYSSSFCLGRFEIEFNFNPNWRTVALTAAAAISGSAVVTLCYGTFETVPYTDRTRFTAVTPAFERRCAENHFASLKKQKASKILSPDHPDSVRVNRILSEIVHAAPRAIARDARRDDDAAASSGLAIESRDTVEVADASSASAAAAAQRDEPRRAQPQTSHLDGLDWEVIVVKGKLVKAVGMPGGKILIYTGLLDNFMTDAEIATVLGHEVGHVIARHLAEKFTKHVWIVILCFTILVLTTAPNVDDTMMALLLRFPFSRRMEIEADQIGILLLGAAGFDPNVAPTVYEKLGKLTKKLTLLNLLPTHPSSKKRSQILSGSKVMEEAIELYREASIGQDTERLLHS